jgi:four helix bundle protein
MLRIYDTVIEVMRMLRPVINQIESSDDDLAGQLRRASTNVALKVSEGSGQAGATRQERYREALGAAREARACLDVAEAFGYVRQVDGSLRDALDRVCGTLVKNVD